MGCKVAVCQMNSFPGKKADNLKKAQALIRSAASLGAELVLLPETFSTGFDIGANISGLAETVPGPTTDLLSDLTRELGVYFYGSLIEESEGKYFNTAVFISPAGQLLAAYRKVHLFSTENELFESGDSPAIVETELGTFGLTICMDLCFPEYIRGLVLSGAEYILNSTDWLRWGPIDRWEWCHKQPRSLATIRALENTIPLAMACQTGREGEFTKFGYSCIVSPSGRVLAGLEEGEGLAIEELTDQGVEEWREIATYLPDRKKHLNLYRKLLDI